MNETQDKAEAGIPGWRMNGDQPSLPEAHRSMRIPATGSWFRKFLAFAGPGYMVAVGYMDPGNWATDIEGGSRFGYTLLSVILLSNLMAVLLQSLSGKLGIVTGKDLAQACRDNYSKPVVITLWLLCELAIAATDLAEVIGAAIALNLLFGLPIIYGVMITAVDVLLILLLQNKGFRTLEIFVVVLIATIGICFGIDLFLSKPDMGQVALGYIPNADIIRRPEMLYIAIGILGATVMPHNLYLHSSIVQTRQYDRTPAGKRQAIKFATWDSSIALTFALFINSAILIVSAATFHSAGMTQVADISEAYHLLTPIVGTTLASVMFAVALLASGQNSTLTGTLAGQIVMEGFVNIRLTPWLRRLITRLIAIIPAVIVTAIYGERGTQDLLIFSQVILSLQLPFAVIPLVRFTSSKTKMGEFANKLWLNILAWLIAGVIVVLNVYLLVQSILF
ncbi:Nramp family divalent metal transporter [Paenibacillus sp. Marseille-P2973]|uniref:Nramp family divalent metal transporter n=1 Tax=Paenibacillus sp. Marseille-P2973 TaxID=1871032 RepID=UPI001B378477|nr:Nramp family divalent metal transporter [Paenibacillus sp. Marseille-P2973]MBQ4899304.1 Nramp family divalent metal transporter [Paenibacillus sp. Marseille-P2973]